MRTILILAAAACSAALPAAAQYVPAKQDPVEVSSAGLDLNTPSGARAMLDRIQSAAQTVCGPRPEKIELGRNRRWQACVDETQARAVLSLNSAKVTELANGGELTRTQISVR